MKQLSMKRGKIIGEGGKSVRLRGFGVGGWMNTENFINGYPGCESTLREDTAEAIGEDNAEFLFDKMLDYFLAPEDIAFMKKTVGCSVVRLPLNYRHFEDDSAPYKYLEKGFKRLDKIVDACEKHGLYAIPDLHAVQGWQDPDWHSDNPYRGTLIWRHPHFQERFCRLWEEFAKRYEGRGVIAGYNVMNEPVTGGPFGFYGFKYKSDWKAMNSLNRRVVKAIRKHDSDHIIILEGDYFSNYFSGMEKPFDPQLLYSSHNYLRPGFVPGPYPGQVDGAPWDKCKMRETLHAHEGPKFAAKHNVPLWVGEFGSLLNGKGNDIPSRLRAVDDQIALMEDAGWHWTIWTYKDIGVMGTAYVDPRSPYMKAVAPCLKAKDKLQTDAWIGNVPQGDIRKGLNDAADKILASAPGLDVSQPFVRHWLSQAVLAQFVGRLIQPLWAGAFKGKSRAEIDRLMKSFALGNCRINRPLLEVMQRHCRRPM